MLKKTLLLYLFTTFCFFKGFAQEVATKAVAWSGQFFVVATNIIPEQKWFFKNFLKKLFFSRAFRLISASLNEHAQRTRKTKPNYFEYNSFICQFWWSEYQS